MNSRNSQKSQGRDQRAQKPRQAPAKSAATPAPPHQHQQAQRGGASSAASAAAMTKFVEHISLDVDTETARSLDVRNKGMATLPPNLGALLKSLRRLDLTGNSLRDLSLLSALPQLSNLNVSGNTGLRTLASLTCDRLVVFSAANCGLTSLTGIERCAVTLRTLVVNDNALQLQAPAAQREAASLLTAASVRGGRRGRNDDAAVGNYAALAALTACETIVLTRNPQLCGLYAKDDEEERAATEGEEDPSVREERQRCTQLQAAAHPLSVFEGMAQLKKLSLSDCGLSCLPARWFLPLVTELRLARNELTSLRPEGVIVRSLKTLDVSHNGLTTVTTLRRCIYVQRLSLRGNPLVDAYVGRDREEHEEKMVGGMASASTAATVPTEGGPMAVPVSLQRSLKRMLAGLESVDGQPLLAADKLAYRRRPRNAEGEEEEGGDGAVRPNRARRTEAVDGGDDDADSLAEEKPPARRARTPLHQQQRKPAVDSVVAAAKVRAEAEERDVVMEAPTGAAGWDGHAPIVRRERTSIAQKKGVGLSGGAAVAQLLKHKTETQGW